MGSSIGKQSTKSENPHIIDRNKIIKENTENILDRLVHDIQIELSNISYQIDEKQMGILLFTFSRNISCVDYHGFFSKKLNNGICTITIPSIDLLVPKELVKKNVEYMEFAEAFKNKYGNKGFSFHINDGFYRGRNVIINYLDVFSPPINNYTSIIISIA